MPRSKATSTADRRSSPHTPEYTFVGGKGGVGKTTCAAALAIASARRGISTLVVSTDPAPSLGDALGQRLGERPRAVRGVSRLHAVEVDAPRALERWLESRRATLEEIALRGTWLDHDDVARLLRLSLPGVDEMAGLLQLADFGRDARYQRIIVDTAPTGHLLRMLDLPSIVQGLARVFDHMQSKHRIMVDALRGGWAPDAADRLIEQLGADAEAMHALLQDPGRSRFWWVTLPEPMSLAETSDGLRWLTGHGVTIEAVVVNRLTRPPSGPCSWCRARIGLEAHTVESLRRRMPESMAVRIVPAALTEPRGVAALAGIGEMLRRRPRVPARPVSRSRQVASLPERGAIVRSTLLATAQTRLLLFGGKGGVGKTTCAAAAALEAAVNDRTRRILLLSTDPAHSLGDVLGQPCSDVPRPIRGAPPNLAVRELDAERVFSQLRDRFASAIEALFRRVGADGMVQESLAGHDRQVMRDFIELAPPGIDELAAIIEVMDTLEGTDRAYDLVVMDTAPAGHTLRLIEMPALVHDWTRMLMAILLKYEPVTGVGDLGAVLLRLSQGLGRLRHLMSDPIRTRFIAVTRAAALPRVETIRVLSRLAAVPVGVPVVLVNALGSGTCSRCRRERRVQDQEIGRLGRALAAAGPPLVLLAPAQIPAPHGAADLLTWRATWRTGSAGTADGR